MSRTRSESSGSSESASVDIVDTYNGEITNEYTVKCGTQSNYEKKIVDVVTPNFLKRIQRGDIINNPLTIRSSEHIQSMDGSLVYRNWNTGNGVNPVNGATTSWSLQVYGGIGHGTWTKLEGNEAFQSRMSFARQKCIANIDSSNFAFGEDVAEISSTLRALKHTFNVIKNPAKTMYKISKRIRRLALRKVRRAKDLGHILEMSDALADAFLTYRFVATPIMKSMHDAVDAYNNPVKPKTKRLIARSKEEQSFNVSGLIYNDTVTLLQGEQSSLIERASIIYEIKNPIYDWKFHLGLRAKDIPATLWAVTTLSFMVDRIYDISSFVKGATNLADPSIQILSGSTSSEYKFDRNYKTVAIDTHDAKSSFDVSSDVVRDSIYNKTRSVWLPSMLDTAPTLDLPGLVDTDIKTADLVALVYSNLRP